MGIRPGLQPTGLRGKPFNLLNYGKESIDRQVCVCIPNIDAHAGDWHRQISLLSLSSFEKMRDLGADVYYGDFAENITVDGIDVCTLPIGAKLEVGETLMEVTQIGKECHNKGCAIKQQVGTCVMPKEGIFAKVLEGGMVKVGDAIKVVQD